VVSNVLESVCFVPEMPETYNEFLHDPVESTARYAMPDGLELDVGYERFKAGESMFRPELGLFDRSMSTVVWDAINKADVVARGDLFNNVVLSGGLTMMTGFNTRLQYELETLATQDGVSDPIRVIAKPERKYMEWIGAAITSTLSSFGSNWITLEQYEEIGPSVVERKGMFTDLRRDATAADNDALLRLAPVAQPEVLRPVEPPPVRVATAENMVLWRAAIEGPAEKLLEALQNDRAEIDAGDVNNEGMSALHFASRYGNADIVECLVAAGADVANKDDFGKTPLHLASSEGRSNDAVSHLIRGGANVNAEDSFRRTPMHYAARGGHDDIVGLLLLAGANKDAADKSFRTPMDWAVTDETKATMAKGTAAESG